MRVVRLGFYVTAAAAVAMGCTQSVDPYTTDADTGSTHALISVERTVSADSSSAVRSDAIARFVNLTADSDSTAVLELVGMSLGLPPHDECASVLERDPSTPLSSLGPVELLEVGNVTIDAGGETHALAPYAFPTVTDTVSGVVYTSRDRSPLPEGVRYAVATSGTDDVPPVSIAGRAPVEPEAVTLGGVPLGEVLEVALSEPVDVTWNVGAPSDLVYVRLTTDDASDAVVCTFPAERGVGTIPAGSFVAEGAGRVSVHRLRSLAFAASGVDRGELRFDFEVAASVDFTN